MLYNYDFSSMAPGAHMEADGWRREQVEKIKELKAKAMGELTDNPLLKDLNDRVNASAIKEIEKVVKELEAELNKYKDRTSLSPKQLEKWESLFAKKEASIDKIVMCAQERMNKLKRMNKLIPLKKLAKQIDDLKEHAARQLSQLDQSSVSPTVQKQIRDIQEVANKNIQLVIDDLNKALIKASDSSLPTKKIINLQQLIAKRKKDIDKAIDIAKKKALFTGVPKRTLEGAQQRHQQLIDNGAAMLDALKEQYKGLGVPEAVYKNAKKELEKLKNKANIDLANVKPKNLKKKLVSILKENEEEVAKIIKNAQAKVAAAVAYVPEGVSAEQERNIRNEIERLAKQRDQGFLRKLISFNASKDVHKAAKEGLKGAHVRMERAARVYFKHHIRPVSQIDLSKQGEFADSRKTGANPFEVLSRRAGVIGINGLYYVAVTFDKKKIAKQLKSFSAQRLSAQPRRAIDIPSGKVIPLNVDGDQHLRLGPGIRSRAFAASSGHAGVASMEREGTAGLVNAWVEKTSTSAVVRHGVLAVGKKVKGVPKKERRATADAAARELVKAALLNQIEARIASGSVTSIEQIESEQQRIERDEQLIDEREKALIVREDKLIVREEKLIKREEQPIINESEKEQIKIENEQIQIEKEQIKIEKDQIKKEKDRIKKEKEELLVSFNMFSLGLLSNIGLTSSSNRTGYNELLLQRDQDEALARLKGQEIEVEIPIVKDGVERLCKIKCKVNDVIGVDTGVNTWSRRIEGRGVPRLLAGGIQHNKNIKAFEALEALYPKVNDSANKLLAKENAEMERIEREKPETYRDDPEWNAAAERFNSLSRNKSAVEGLMQDIEQLLASGDAYLSATKNPFELNARLAALGNRMNEILIKDGQPGISVDVFCMSGKDRTAIQMAVISVFDDYYRTTGEYPSVEMMKDPRKYKNTDPRKYQQLMAFRRDFGVRVVRALITNGSLDIQELNTGVRGTKSAKGMLDFVFKFIGDDDKELKKIVKEVVSDLEGFSSTTAS